MGVSAAVYAAKDHSNLNKGTIIDAVFRENSLTTYYYYYYIFIFISPNGSKQRKREGKNLTK